MKKRLWNFVLLRLHNKAHYSTRINISQVRSLFKINNNKNDLISINSKLIKRKDLLNQLVNPQTNRNQTNIQNLNHDSPIIVGKLSSDRENLDQLSYNLLKNQGLSSCQLDYISQLLSIMRDDLIVPEELELSIDDNYELVIEKLKKMIRSTYVKMLDSGVDMGPCDVAIYIKFLNSLQKEDNELISMYMDRLSGVDITKNVILLAAFAQMYHDYPYWRLYRVKDSKLPLISLKKILPFHKLSEIPDNWINSEDSINSDVGVLLQRIRERDNDLYKCDYTNNWVFENPTDDRDYQLSNFTMSVKHQFDTKYITVKSLASHLGCDVEKVMEIAKNLIDATNYNCRLTIDESEFIASELGYVNKIPGAKYMKQNRPPIIAIMGHVDHGKTTLLDSFRNSSIKITSSEVGGITQRLSSFQVKLSNDLLVTFIDTPGHCAFTSMRSRGSSITDIIILVIAADDGIMPQTIESYERIKSSKSALIVAINKIDRVKSTECLKNQLLSLGIHESVPIIEISAKYNINIDRLENAISEVTKTLQLESNYHNESRGKAFILETGVNGLYGKQITVIVLDGVLKESSWVVVGSNSFKIRMLLDEDNKPIKIAYPSQAISLIGLNDISAVAGEILTSTESQKEANKIASMRLKQLQVDDVRLYDNVVMNELLDMYINVIIKSVDQGSLEAILQWIDEFNLKCSDHPEKHLRDRGFTDFDITKWRPIRVISSSVGPISAMDLRLANIKRCYFITFSLVNSKSIEVPENVIIREHDIIYNLFDDIQSIFNKHFGPLYTIVTEARMRVIKLANINVKKSIKHAIGTITSGGVATNSHIYTVIRNGVIIYEDLNILSMHVNKLKVDCIPANNSNNAIVFKEDVEIEIGDEILAQTKIKNECH